MPDIALITVRSATPSDAREEQEHAIRDADLEITYRLPHGTLVHGNPEAYARLEAEGYRVRVFQDTNVVQTTGVALDIRDTPGLGASNDSPSLPAEGWTHFIAQLIAPPLPAWIKDIQERNVEVVDTVGRFGLFLVGELHAATAVAELAFVAWVGPFAPRYRVSTSVLEREERVRYLVITTYPPEAREAIGNALVQRGSDIVRDLVDGPYGVLFVECEAREAMRVAQLPNVRSVTYVSDVSHTLGERACRVVASHPPLTTDYQTWLRGQGVTGSGVTIGICDQGVEANNVSGAPHPVHPDLGGRQTFAVQHALSLGNAFQDAMGHGTHVAGIAVGDGQGTGDTEGPSGMWLGDGVAFEANFGSIKIVKTFVPISFGDMRHKAVLLSSGFVNEFADLAADSGAQIMNNSWEGSSPTYDIASRFADRAVRRSGAALTPLTLVFGAGNRGPTGSIHDVGLAKNVITVGASGNTRAGTPPSDVWAFSCRGPAPQPSDPRILPTVVAPGSMVVSTLGKCGKPFRDDDSVTHNQHALGGNYVSSSYACLNAPAPVESGTSWAAPHVAGACALLIDSWRQWNGGTDPSPALLKAWLINGADDLGEATGDLSLYAPSHRAGWGRVNLANLLTTQSRGPRLFVDETHTFGSISDPAFAKYVTAVDPTKPMRITLVWTDLPGETGNETSPQLKNDLDLEVTSDAGHVFKGNKTFVNGYTWASPWFVNNDSLNNIECVYIQKPDGFYWVHVVAAALAAESGVVTPQDFALVFENAQYADPEATTVVVFDDCSSSMRALGYAFVCRLLVAAILDFLDSGTLFGIAGTEGGSDEASPHARLGASIDGHTHRSRLHATLDATQSSDRPPLAAALADAKDGATNAAERAAVFLISDGYGRVVEVDDEELLLEKVAARDPQIPIHSIATGPTSDQGVLFEVARRSAGRYYYAPSPAGFAEVCCYLLSRQTGHGVVQCDQHHTGREITAVVDKSCEAIRFLCCWTNDDGIRPRESDLSISLKTPSGQQVSLNSCHVRTTRGPGHLLVDVDHPPDGEWQIVAVAPGGRTARCTVASFVRSPIALETWAQASRVEAGHDLTVRAKFVPKDQLATEFEVTARVVGPGKSLSDLRTERATELAELTPNPNLLEEGVPEDLVRIMSLQRLARDNSETDIFGTRLQDCSFERTGPNDYAAKLVAPPIRGSHNVVVTAVAKSDPTIIRKSLISILIF